MKKFSRSILLIMLLFLLSISISAAAGVTTGMKAPDYSDSFRLIPDTEGFKTPDPSFFVWETGGILGSVIGYISNMLLLISTSALKLSIWILNMGLHPKWLNTTIDAMAEAAHTKGWTFVDNLWPLIIIGAFILVGKDYSQGSMSTIIKRLMTFGISLVIMASLLNMPSTAPAKALTGVVDFADWISVKFMSVFADTNSKTIYGSVWEQMAVRPYEAGQFGDINTKITAEEAVKINKSIEPYAVVAGMRWVDAVLWFAPDTDERGDIIDIYADIHEKKYESAKNPYSRINISVIALLTSILSSLFLFFMGGIMLLLVAYFLVLIVASIIVLPLGLIPTKEPVMVMKYLQRILGVFMTVVFIYLYIGVTLMLTNVITMMQDVEYLFTQLLVMLTFVAALIMFFVLISKMQSAPGLKHMNSVLSPINRAGQSMGRRYRRNSRRRILDNMEDDEEFDDYVDHRENVNAERQIRRNNSNKRSDRATNQVQPVQVQAESTAPADVKTDTRNKGDRMVTRQNRNKESLDNSVPPEKPMPKDKVNSENRKDPAVNDKVAVTQTVASQDPVNDPSVKNISDTNTNSGDKHKENETNHKSANGDRSEGVNSVAGNDATEVPNEVIASKSAENKGEQNGQNQMREVNQATKEVASSQENNDLQETSNKIRMDHRSRVEGNQTQQHAHDRTSGKTTEIENKPSQTQGISKEAVNELVAQSGKINGAIRDRADNIEKGLRDTELYQKGEISKIQDKDSDVVRARDGVADTTDPRPSVVPEQGHQTPLQQANVREQSERNNNPEIATKEDLNKLRSINAEKDQAIAEVLNETEVQLEKIENVSVEVNQRIRSNQTDLQKIVNSKQEDNMKEQGKGTNADRQETVIKTNISRNQVEESTNKKDRLNKWD